MDAQINKVIEGVNAIMIKSTYVRTLDWSDIKTAMTLVEKCGADVGQKTTEGVTILHLLCKYPPEIFVEFCLINVIVLSKIINEQDCYGNTPIHSAINCNNIPMAEFLLSIDGIDLRNRYNWMLPPPNMLPIHYAVALNRLVMVELLVKHDKNLIDLELIEKGLTPTFFAATNGFLEILKYLGENGADLGKQYTESKVTILHLLANPSAYSKKVVEYLLDKLKNSPDIINISVRNEV